MPELLRDAAHPSGLLQRAVGGLEIANAPTASMQRLLSEKRVRPRRSHRATHCSNAAYDDAMRPSAYSTSANPDRACASHFGVARRARVRQRLLLRRLRGARRRRARTPDTRAGKPRATTRAADAPRAPAARRVAGHRAPHPSRPSRDAPRRCRCMRLQRCASSPRATSARSKAAIEPVASPVSRARSPSKRARSCRTSSVTTEARRRAAPAGARHRSATRPLRSAPPRGTPQAARAILRAIEMLGVQRRVAVGIPRRGAQVQRAAVAVQQRRVGAVANQRVHEAEAAGIGVVGAHEVAAEQRARVVGRIVEQMAQQRRDRSAGRPPPPPAPPPCPRAAGGRGGSARRSGCCRESPSRRRRCAGAASGTADCPARARRNRAPRRDSR